MKVWASVRRFRWSIGAILVAAGSWWAAFNYLVDFRAPDVPFVTTPKDVITAMLDLAEVTDKDTVYDLGAGDGRIVIAAARDRRARGVGIEIDPELVEVGNQAIKDAGLADRVTIRRGDLFKQDISPATVVTLFLMPNLNAQLRPQLEKLHPGTRVVSHQFSMPGAVPNKKITFKSAETGFDHPIYLWVAPITWE
jgi:tRNA A58 N-methylase Trm61